MSRIVDKWKAFCEWQQRPSRVPTMTDEFHRCHTCGREFQGNYCPCCGQSARIGRYSFKNALLLFLDVWGVGNRGMFRTLRDLILRPGYLIRDYISGMQMAYYPPFKLLFWLTAFLLVVESGVNLKGEDYLQAYHEKTVSEFGDTSKEDVEKGEGETSQHDISYNVYLLKMREFREERPAFYDLLVLSLLAVPLYVFFRKSPHIPDLRFSELLVAMVYIWAMQDIYEIVLTFFSISGDVQDALYLLPIIPLKQLFGFKWWRTILYVVLSYLATIMILFVALWSAAYIQMYLEA